MKNTRAAIGDFEGQICPVRRFSSRKVLGAEGTQRRLNPKLR